MMKIIIIIMIMCMIKGKNAMKEMNILNGDK